MYDLFFYSPTHRDLVLLKVQCASVRFIEIDVCIPLQTEKPYFKIVAIYLLQDPRGRLSDMKKTNHYRSKQGDLKQWTSKTYQAVLPSLCTEMLGMSQSFYFQMRKQL